jgi:hypothetical protein
MREEAPANDGVVGLMKLEEEGLTGSERPKLPTPAWVPEIHLIQVRSLREETIPIFIGDGQPRTHAAIVSELVLQPGLSAWRVWYPHDEAYVATSQYPLPTRQRVRQR